MKRFFSLILSLLLIVAAYQKAQAQNAVYCTNCGTENTQLFNKLQMIKQVETSVQQLQTQMSQYQDMLTNSKGFSTQLWGNAMSDIAKLNNLIQQGKALAYSASNLDSQFAKRYGDYRDYQNKKMNTTDWDNKYTQWSRETNDNALYTMKALGLQSAQMQDEDALMQQLQTMSGTALGRMQAIQLGNMMTMQNIRQLQKLRQLVMLQLQMQSDYLAAQQDKEAAQQAARRQFYHKTNFNNADGTRF